ncbi:hypothetical protein H0A64_07175 [Alcaligenaceae bacterium]|nr:hypothetical protein [Alcaligenaceae bacterium]
MTVSSTTRKAGPYTGNGVADTFAFDFVVFMEADVVVVRTDLAGVETTLSPHDDYSVVLNANQNTSPGGSVTLPAALAQDFLLTLTSDVPILQPLDLTNQGGFHPEVINRALDRLTVQSQQLAEQLSRSIKLGISDPTPADEYRDSLLEAAADAVAAASAAQTSESNAHDSEEAAALSAGAALVSEGKAHDSEEAAALSESNAHDSEEAAALSAGAALVSEGKAHDSEVAAATSESNAHDSEEAAALSESNASTSEANAKDSELLAKGYAEAAADHDPYTAANVEYDSTVSGLAAENVQAAVDELSTANNIGIKTAVNASGDAPIYACRAWVNFNGTGVVAIRASGNVSSITDKAPGNYVVNFAIPMTDANYAVDAGSTGLTSATGNNDLAFNVLGSASSGATDKTATHVEVFAGGITVLGGIDIAEANVIIFR